MTTPFDRNRPAPPAPGRISDAPDDFAPKQPVAFSSASLRETGESPAEAARRLGMIDPAFMRPAGSAAPAGAAGADETLVASREPVAYDAPTLHAAHPHAYAEPAPMPDGYADGAHVGPFDPIAARRAPEAGFDYTPLAPVSRDANIDDASLDYVWRELAAQAHEPPLEHAPEGVAEPIRAQREPAPPVGGFAGAVASAKAFLAVWWARRRAARAAAAERAGDHAGEAGAARHHKLTPKEKRWRRRRQRLVFEEGLAWVLVPVILVGLYYAVIGSLALFGMTIDDLVEGLNVAWAQLS